MKYILFLLLLTSHLAAQPYNWKRPLISGAASFVGGAAWGTHETISHHYYQFEKRFPNANPQFWNPELSWRNKYKGGDPERGPAYPGSMGALVWTTDAKHLLATTNQVMLFGSGIVIGLGEKRPWWHYGIDIVITGAAYSLGFNFTYNLLFKN